MFLNVQSIQMRNKSQSAESSTESISTAATTTSDQATAVNEKGSARKILSHVSTLLWPKDSGLRGRVVAAFGFLIGAKLFNVAVPYFFKHAVDSLGPSTEAIVQDPTIWFTMGPISMIVGYGIAKTLSSLFTELRGAVFSKVTQASIRLVSMRVFEHLLTMDISFHLQRKTGALSTIIERGKRGINFLLTSLLFNIVPTLFELSVVSSIFYFSYGANFALTALGAVFFYGAWTIAITQWRTKFRKQMNKAENDANSRVVDSLINYETVKYFQNEKYEAQRYDEYLKKFADSSVHISTSLSTLNFGQSFIFSLALTYIMYLTANKIMTGDLTVGDLVMVNTLLFQLSIPLNFLGTVYRETTQAITDIEHLFSLLDTKSNVQNITDKELVVNEHEGVEIEFRNVSFSYEAGRKILDNVSFVVKPGSTLGVCGPSGSGKSTILKLLFRFYDPTEGQILVNGQDIKSVSLESLRRIMGFIPQDCVLFNDTLKHNIEYGRLGSSDEEIKAAVDKAHLTEIIERLPKGLDTQVGERGLKLSGGEKQRTAIARAILRAPKILCCDESTSSLDSKSEKRIMSAIEELFSKTSTIMIAHRLSTIQNADQIIVLDNYGSIAEVGTHAELIKHEHGLYSELWKRQAHHH
ncbi:hypothetical protein C9374_008662 [Naegleria lovaniensis]|uniref:ABC transporter n=1 Tax=Naegleria lovaniensis TaxID=51637 RepID=A0AA88KFS5_NAELO|nr:uncharacterized protein C9374_008662 [Naegleria lovaniensis]KAG2378040.1 hypothetical protein C9374_008662 [Naegleria lovaniensis]